MGRGDPQQQNETPLDEKAESNRLAAMRERFPWTAEGLRTDDEPEPQSGLWRRFHQWLSICFSREGAGLPLYWDDGHLPSDGELIHLQPSGFAEEHDKRRKSHLAIAAVLISGVAVGVSGANWWYSSQGELYPGGLGGPFTAAVTLERPLELRTLHSVPGHDPREPEFLAVRTDQYVTVLRENDRERPSPHFRQQLARCIQDVQTALEARGYTRATFMNERAAEKLEASVRQVELIWSDERGCLLVQGDGSLKERLEAPVYDRNGQVTLDSITPAKQVSLVQR